VILLNDTLVSEIDGKRVMFRVQMKLVVDHVDMIVVAMGMKGYNPLESTIDDQLLVYVVGDAKKVRKAKEVICSAFETNWML